MPRAPVDFPLIVQQILRDIHFGISLHGGFVNAVDVQSRRRRISEVENPLFDPVRMIRDRDTVRMIRYCDTVRMGGYRYAVRMGRKRNGMRVRRQRNGMRVRRQRYGM